MNNHADIVKMIESAPDPGAAAGTWWASALREPNFDNGADNQGSLAAQLIAHDIATGNPQSESALEVFAGKLAQKVNDRLKTQDWGFNLYVDYHPDETLYSAAREANLTVGYMSWPWKTSMLITPAKVEVRAGYSASFETIWTRETAASN